MIICSKIIIKEKQLCKQYSNKTGGTYSKQGDYLIPDLTLSTGCEFQLGRYAMMHRAHLERHRRITYINFLTSGKLNEYLHEVEQTALARLSQLTKQLALEQGVTEQLKVENQMQWVQRMNCIKNQAEEIVNTELIYA